MDRPLRGLRRLEHLDRGVPRERRRLRASAGARAAAGGRSISSRLTRRRARAAAPPDRHRRVRPGVRRRAGAGLGDPGRRRSGHRQIDPAAAGRGGARAGGGRRRAYITGEEAVEQVRLRAAAARRRGRARSSSPRRATCATSSATLDRADAPDLVVIDSIQTMYLDTLDSAPGTVSQVRGAAQELIRLAKRRGFVAGAGRPRHQGGRHRRPARARAHGRHRALFRRRARPPVPHPARGQEPLRRRPTRSACSR